MSPTSGTIAPTFREYLTQHNIPADAEHLGQWHNIYEQELFTAEHAPKVIPPCPSWCSEPTGHDYTCTDGSGADLAFERFHCSPVGAVLMVDALERNHYGTVTLGAPSVHLDERPDVDAAGARALAADLLAAADLLDRIAQ